MEVDSFKGRMILIILLLFMSVVGMVVDLVSPSLPAIATSLNLSDGLVKSVISLYLLGYALGNFFIGLLTDALGRQKLIRFSLVFFAFFSLLPVLYPNVTILLLSRFGQGVAIGAVAVLIRSILSDSFEPQRLVKMGPILGAMWGLGPVIGPVIGGYLQFYFNWQANFIFFTLIALIFLIAIFVTVPETIKYKHPLSLKKMSKNLLEVSSHGTFMALVLSMGIVYALIITFQTLAPFLIQDVFGHSPVYFGHVALMLGLIFLSATFICRYLLKYFSVKTIFFIIIHIALVLLTVLFIVTFFNPNSFILLMLASAMMFFICGFIFPLSSGKGLSLFRHISGAASAVMYLVNVLITSFISFLESFINAFFVIEVLLVYMVLMVLLTAVYWIWLDKGLQNT